MILSIGRFAVDPAQREAFLDFARTFVADERNAAGCLAFDIYEDVNTPNTFLLHEQWEDEDALDAHDETDASALNSATLDGFIFGEPSFDTYEF